MKISLSAAFLALSWASAAQAACSSNLLVDNFANYANHLNSLGQYTSDDGTTTNLKADVANKKITFTGGINSYFYTTFACEKATTDGYNAITFPLKGPANAKFTIELQTSTTCSAAYTSKTTQLSGVTGSTQTFTVPFSAFSGANINAIQGIVFESFTTTGAWEIGQIELVCAGGAGSSSSAVSSSTKPASSTSVASSTSKASTAASSSTTSKPTTSATLSTVVTKPASSTSSAVAGQCTPLLVDDFASQSRLTFLFYNAMLLPSSDDGTMKAVADRPDTATSVIVSGNHLTLTPANTDSYWYTMLGCTKATNIYGGIGMTIKAPAGTTFTIELQTSATCDSSNPKLNDLTSTQLGWTFDGTEKYYTIPFSKFTGLDTDHVLTLLFAGLSKAITLGPIAFYCGTTGTAYPVPSTVAVVEPSATVPATVGPSAFVIDTFANADSNNLGFYHGGDDTTHFTRTSGKLTINTQGNSDLSWYTQLSGGCTDFTPNDKGYLHIAYTGSNSFTIALQQHNPTCNPDINPYPYTWDSVEASRYSDSGKTNVYVPLSHFNIDRTKTIGFALKGFFTNTATVISKIEIVTTVPSGTLVPSKLATAPLIFACTRPNSFAFAIDDGSPEFAQRVVASVAAANIKVTFFTVGAALLDASTNLTNVYKGMLAAGHQVALHSFTHPPMEGLSSLAAIDWELQQDIDAVQKTLGISSTYFRPPFGTEGARIRQRLAALIPGSKFVEWSVDVQDWLWATSTTPEKQLTNFQADFIDIARKTGKQLMRVDQCLEDPNAPPL
ncbi:carbohydrate esterase family 4 protein [Halenospora varia]|nr:carbohydrate esterase family 4 protein [Halenospora varia]